MLKNPTGPFFVGQLGKLRADWQSARVAIANRHAGYQPAPHGNSAAC